MTTTALLDLERLSVASRSSRPLTPARCSARRTARLTPSLSVSAFGVPRCENTRPRFRNSELRPRRASQPQKCQVTSGANYDRGPKQWWVTVFTQTDPMPMGAGTAFESAYVYGLNNPLRFVDPSGLRGQSTTCTTRVPIKSAAPQRLALTAPGAPQFDCESAWAKLLDGVFRVRRGALQGTKGLAVRFREMIQGGYDGAGRFPPGSPAARAEFEVHRVEYENQRVGGSGKRGLRKVLSDWKDNCPDDDPPSSVEVLQRLDVENWINASAPTWDQVSAAANQVPASPSGQPGPNWFQRNIFNPINDASDAFWRELTKPRPAPRIPIPMPLPVPA